MKIEIPRMIEEMPSNSAKALEPYKTAWPKTRRRPTVAAVTSTSGKTKTGAKYQTGLTDCVDEK